MANSYISTQIAPLVSTTGNSFTQNVALTTGANSLALGTPGYATPSGGPSPGLPSSSTLPTSWGVYLFLAAVVYFAFQKLS